jgi:hypothetical protein
MANDAVYHYRFNYDATGGGDKGGTGDWYEGYVVGDKGVYTQGQVVPGDHGSYQITKIDNYDTDQYVAKGADWKAGNVYVTNYHDVATNKDYKPYHYEHYEAGDKKQQSGYGGLGSEQDYVKHEGTTDAYGVKAPDEYYNFGSSGNYSYGGSKPDSKYSYTYREDNGSWHKGWVVDDSDRYAPGDTWKSPYGTYTIDKEEAVPYTTAWHPEPKDHSYDNGYVHVTDYYKADTGKTYSGAEVWNTAQGDGYASSYHGLGHETDYVQEAGQWKEYVHNGDIVW